MTHNRQSVLALGVALLTLSMAPSVFASDPCQPIFDAMVKVVTTPSHTFTDHTAAFTHGRPRSSETIYVSGKVFIRVNGKWMTSPVTPKEVLDQQKENQATGKPTCHVLRDDVVGGEPATIYSMHLETDNGKEDAQVWISMKTGLPLRDEQDMDTGGSLGKEHRSTHFEYSNIHPPL